MRLGIWWFWFLWLWWICFLYHVVNFMEVIITINTTMHILTMRRKTFFSPAWLPRCYKDRIITIIVATVIIISQPPNRIMDMNEGITFLRCFIRCLFHLILVEKLQEGLRKDVFIIYFIWIMIPFKKPNNTRSNNVFFFKYKLFCILFVISGF